MFKDKFKKLVDFNENISSFEIIRDTISASIVGGHCANLLRCGEFSSTCGALESCTVFREPQEQ